MRGSLASIGLCAALSVGCGQSVSPAAPSAVGAVGTSLADTMVDASRTARSVVHTGAVMPFKGTLEGRYGAPAGQFPLISESIVATGEATLLGRYTLEIAETVNLLEATATGTFTFTAANGDTIHGTFTGQAQPGALVSITENATVVGGTGRFAGATGSFSIHRLFDPVNRTTTGTLDGSISLR